MKAWQCTRAQWLAHLGVHEPHIAEISPMQVGLMRERQRAAYLRKRSGQWAESAAAKDEWARLVREAHANGEVDLASASDEVREEIHAWVVAERKREQLAAERAAKYETVPFADVRVGDILHSKLGVVRVLKKNRVTLKCALVSSDFPTTLRDVEFVRER